MNALTAAELAIAAQPSSRARVAAGIIGVGLGALGWYLVTGASNGTAEDKVGAVALAAALLVGWKGIDESVAKMQPHGDSMWAGWQWQSRLGGIVITSGTTVCAAGLAVSELGRYGVATLALAIAIPTMLTVARALSVRHNMAAGAAASADGTGTDLTTDSEP